MPERSIGHSAFSGEPSVDLSETAYASGERYSTPGCHWVLAAAEAGCGTRILPLRSLTGLIPNAANSVCQFGAGL